MFDMPYLIVKCRIIILAYVVFYLKPYIDKYMPFSWRRLFVADALLMAAGKA